MQPGTNGDDPRRLFAGETGGLAYEAIEARGSDVLAVVFSQVRVPTGRFGLRRLFGRTSHACLFLNQPENAWYRGVEVIVDGVVERALAETGAGKLVFYGSSMGAFGALAAASRRPEARAVVFAPDFRIGEAGSRSAEAGVDSRPGEWDLLDLLARPRNGSIDMAAPLFDPYDAGVAARLAEAGLPDAVRLVPLASSHEVHDHLHSLNVIRRVIAGFSRDLAIEAASRDLLVTVDDWKPYAALATLDRARIDGELVDPAVARALGLPDNPGVLLLQADLHEARGDLGAACDVLGELAALVARSARLSSLPKRYLKDIPRRRIALLRRLGRHAEADRLTLEAADAYPTDEGFRDGAAGLTPAAVLDV